MTRTCSWIRYTYNGNEPDNRIIFYGVETDIPDKFTANELSFYGAFNDGAMSCLIVNNDDGSYSSFVDGDETVCNSFVDAWEKLPAYLTHPDHFEESKLFICEE